METKDSAETQKKLLSFRASAESIYLNSAFLRLQRRRKNV